MQPISEKQCIFSSEEIKKSIVTADNITPFHLYHGDRILENGKKMLSAFRQYFPSYTNFFAVKATPNPHILSLLKSIGMGVDCSSLAELLLAEKVGLKGNEIMFTSNNTPKSEYIKAYELGATINLDDITQIDYLHDALGGKMPEMVSLRYNPGPLKNGNCFIGKPQEAKFGLTGEQLFEAYAKLKSLGVSRFGLHCMVASNELKLEYFEETAVLLFETLVAVAKKLDIGFEMVNLGGGIGIPYRLDQTAVDFYRLAQLIDGQFQKIVVPAQLKQLPSIVTECGRVVTGPYGVLVTKAIHSKSIYREYIGVDACMANLMRPGMYNAYHYMSVLDSEKRDDQTTKKYDIVGSLCENNDKFAVDRELPVISRDDVIIIHDTGAHGHSMGFNYNGKLRSAEYILLGDQIKCIRRAETYDDLFRTLDFDLKL
ncbi:group IV decarboxylase [Heterostelium album PN500]|uniref:Group IV decarboxylase n=1 Tax=Heterostelium pallidum (strain ATCC 26659 / Pp 5 / PN500) TaxID=670386 RepID=D3AYE6_HETP5|nr:group IV decarboxylase [Heterostelium album PN500]EFA85973.1 group IV decarboxylase [Heterostelium album PN500]|eukprot:XP_020438079.1 group IV decarboxylase [Heterostelium album PN500]